MSMSADVPELRLRGCDYPDLFEWAGLERLDRRFSQRVVSIDEALAARLTAYRQAANSPAGPEHSELLLALAKVLEVFLGELFGIEAELERASAQTRRHNVVFRFRSEFVAKRARRHRKPLSRSFAELDQALGRRLGEVDRDPEYAVAAYGVELLGDPRANAEALDELTEWCVLALRESRPPAAWSALRLPQRLDHAHLVAVNALSGDPAGRVQGDAGRWRRRDGFGLTDARMSAREVQAQVDYCVYCHEHSGDFCSKGFPAQKGRPQEGFKVNPLGDYLTGCPLEEKISEMQLLKRDGHTLAALAMAMIDNPMVPATGHRICNDCMKSCIYQKQDPVDIPQIETRILTDVLALPWGVELYDLLTRWNPLRHKQFRMRPFNGRRVLIAGMGPAGFTMAHHLTMEGCAVVGIDGLKIEPLPHDLVRKPIRDWSAVVEPLDERVLAGFGGVAEYGITSRWDKNFLKLIYLTLSRRPYFRVFGGVRFGGTMTLQDAWREDFDHVCIATGAGLPRVIPMGNSLARGMRQANDFLMALQLTGAAKASSLANLQLRLPVVVIGGGLTAIDAATEAQAYYVVQVEKTLEHYERLVSVHGESAARAGLDAEGVAVLEEFLAHAREVRSARGRAREAGEAPDLIRLLRAWGGVTIAYRRSLNESPAYLRNHEEVAKALEEGVLYAEGLDPVRAVLDEHGHVRGMTFRRRHRSGDGRWLETWSEVTLPARSVLVAAGASPNTVYENEYPGTFEREADHYLPHVCHTTGLQPVRVGEHAKAPEFGAFTSYRWDDRYVSFIGDTHPVFHGSVVKAIASAQRSYRHVLKAMAQRDPAQGRDDVDAFLARMDSLLQARVDSVQTDDPAIIELRIHAPLAARNYRAGQFFRLQTYERLAPVVEGTCLQIPVATVSGAGAEQDCIRLMLLPFGPVPKIAARLLPGDPVVLMGPTGAPAQVPQGKTVLVISGQWGAAAMLDLGPTLRAAGNRVVCISMYGEARGIYAKTELERAADQIIWCVERGEPVIPAREVDRSLRTADVVEVLVRWSKSELSVPAVLGEIDHVLVMGSTGLLKALRRALSDELAGIFREDIEIVGTAGSPMQCMLKGVCGQCLQWQIDPENGQRTRAVFSCAMQDQPLRWLDLDNLAARQGQNRLAENLNAKWVDELLRRGAGRRDERGSS